MLGISCGYLSNLTLFNSGLIFTIILLLWVITEFLLRKVKITLSSRLSTILYLLIIFSASFLWFKVADHNLHKTVDDAEFLKLYAWENVELEGTIKEKGYSASGKRVYVAEVSQSRLEEGLISLRNYRIRLYDDQFETRDLQTGSSFRAIVKLYEFPERRNPHDFDYGGWLHSQKIVAHGELSELIEKSTSQAIFSWINLRGYVQKNIDALFDPQIAPMAKALFLGYKEEISEVTRKNFSRSGLSHIMAVSGLHVGFIVAPIWFIIPFLWTRRWGKWAGLILLTVLLIGYSGLTGFSASVSRASLMAWLITYGKLFNKVRNSINLTAGAAIILLMINPYQLFDVGFQLSFGAVFTILLLMPEAQRIIPARYRYGKIGAFATIVIISVVVQAGLFPILTYYFGEFSIAGPIANAFVIPIMTITVPAGLVMSLLPISLSRVLAYAVMPVEWSLVWIEIVAQKIGGNEWSYFSISNESLLIFLFWILVILFLGSIRIPEVRWKLLIGVLIVFNLFLVEQIVQKSQPNPLRVTFLDVGQGDAIHIQTPSDKHILVDVGRWSPGYDSGSNTITPYLKQIGVEKIDAIILSHPHADHIGGIVSLLNEFDVSGIYQSSYEYESQLYSNYIKTADELGVPVKNIFAGELPEIDDNLRFYILGPMLKEAKPSSANNYSVVVKAVYGDRSVLLTGDAEKGQERELVNIYGDFLKSDLYKMGHHGSRTSSTENFLEKVNPELSVASLAFRNRFRHPNLESVTRLSNYSEKNYYTSLEGAVVIVTDGKNLQKIDWK
ncbi:MAG: DNA internalization-related competence protein ComEC/Rec2 [Rhodohalobacter sp.]